MTETRFFSMGYKYGSRIAKADRNQIAGKVFFRKNKVYLRLLENIRFI